MTLILNAADASTLLNAIKLSIHFTNGFIESPLVKDQKQKSEAKNEIKKLTEIADVIHKELY